VGAQTERAGQRCQPPRKRGGPFAGPVFRKDQLFLVMDEVGRVPAKKIRPLSSCRELHSAPFASVWNAHPAARSDEMM
jgi:hypothetical protein